MSFPFKARCWTPVESFRRTMFRVKHTNQVERRRHRPVVYILNYNTLLYTLLFLHYFYLLTSSSPLADHFPQFARDVTRVLKTFLSRKSCTHNDYGRAVEVWAL
jgi:hypothetical protein